VEIIRGPEGNKGYGFIIMEDYNDVLKVIGIPHKIFGKLVQLSI